MKIREEPAMPTTIRLATPDDAEQVRAIYAPLLLYADFL
jgi:hypothetical protein